MRKRSLLLILGLLAFVPFTEGKTKAKAKAPDAEELLQKGISAFYNYEFEEAADLFDEYREKLNKQKKPLDEELEIYELRNEIASGALERVQKITIVDSISVDRDKFFEVYKLAESAGKIGNLADLKLKNAFPGMKTTDSELEGVGIAFISENGDYVFTTIEEDIKDGDEIITTSVLKESRRLLNGEWENRETLEGDLEKSGDFLYPFMSGDGQTFYFANNGEDSMGGLDIFVAQKDPLTGQFLQPLNLGMPFNSPYDDFMMAIDEEKGVGWWATDRNSEDGKVTVYVYKLEEIRKNYPPDTDNLVDYAKITNWRNQNQGSEGK